VYGKGLVDELNAVFDWGEFYVDGREFGNTWNEVLYREYMVRGREGFTSILWVGNYMSVL
jgi:hypothetical protein